MKIEICNLHQAYTQYFDQIINLYARVHTPNLGYEPKRVQNLLNAFGKSSFANVSVFMLFDADKLMLVIPFEAAQINRLLPFKVYKSWIEDMNLFGDPLVDAQNAQQAMVHFGKWLDENNINFIFNYIDQQNAQYILPLAQNTNKAIWQYERGSIETTLQSKDYALEYTSSSRRRALRKNRKQLDKAGNVEFIVLDSLVDNIDQCIVDQWITDFLIVENSGWKGDEGTSLATDPRIKTYFEDSIKTWFADQQIMAFELRLDNKVIASFYVQVQKTQAGNIGYAIRTAYLEEYISMAPGFLIAQYLYAYMMDEYKFLRIDSCALPSNQVAKALMGQKYGFASYAVAPNAGSTVRLTAWLEQKRLQLREAIKAKVAKFRS